MPQGLVSCEEAAQRTSDPNWVFFDVRYDLMDKEKGLREYGKGHIPGAYYAHIDRDLSGPVGAGHKGRHPLPFESTFQRFCSQHGITPATQVVCYDDQAGQWASRLWWLLRHYGHTNVALLDGGLTRWKALKLPVRAMHERARAPVPFAGKPGNMPTVDAQAVARGGLTLLDARAPERYRGDVEPVDKRAGHIPGARNLPFAAGVGPDMRFLAPDLLRARFEATGAAQGGPSVACYCGSGVTGPHLVLEAELAGLPTPALYPGSYSEWQWPEAGRPVETGVAATTTV